jgi:hypothetical protein
MKPENKIKCLQEDIDHLVGRYAQDCIRHKNRALRLKIASVLLAAMITILLGLKISNPTLKDYFSNIALIFGGLITVLSAFEAFFDPRSLWVRETVTFARLKDLQRDLRFWASGLDPEDIQPEMLNAFKRRLDHVLDESLKYWVKIKGAPDIERTAEAALPRARQEVNEQRTESAIS